MHSMTDRAGQWIDQRFEKLGANDNPQLQEKRDAFRALFAGIPAVAQGGKPPIEASAEAGEFVGSAERSGRKNRKSK